MEEAVLTVPIGTRCVIDTVKDLKSSLLEALNESSEGVLLDVSQIEEIDTAGIQLFVSLFNEVEKRKIPLKFKGPMNEKVLEQFQLSGVRYGEQING